MCMWMHQSRHLKEQLVFTKREPLLTVILTQCRRICQFKELTMEPHT
uniref:Uncharacterized protein n=1 Tax=Rhizophora mucronata TaxID=61149 RepID=A0A2P2NBC1_RHIMU